MIKRINRITALVVAATSIAAVTPAMAKTTELEEQAGEISKAVAYKDGKYIYEGYKNDGEEGIYYNDGTSPTSDKSLEDIERLDDVTKFNSNYISTDPNKNEQINLEDGSVNDNLDSIEDSKNLIKGRLKTKLGKSNRYGKDVNVKEVDAVTKSGFKNNIWYSYQAEVSEAYNEKEFLVEDTNVYDEERFADQTRVEIAITALWNSKFTIDGKEFTAGASTKSGAKLTVKQILNTDFEHYKVGQAAAVATDSTGKYYKIMMTLLPKEGYETPIELPEDIISMYDDKKKTWNTVSGLQQYEMSATLIKMGGEIFQDTWSSEFDNQSRIEIDVTALYNSKFRIAGKEFDAGSSSFAGAKKVKQELLNAQFDNYTVGQVVMLSSDGKNYHVKMTLLPKDGVEIQQELPDGFIAMLDKETWKTTLEAWEMAAKATVVGGAIVQDTWSNQFDNQSRIEIDISALWNNFKIAGKEFASTGNSFDGAKNAKQELLNAQFDNYTVGQVAMLTSDGTYYHVKMTLLPKAGVEIESQVADDFISMFEDGSWKTKSALSWQMGANATVVGGIVDKNELTALYNNHKDDEQGSYTNASWDVFRVALNNAKTVIDNENATQDTVNLAKTNLNNAISGLVEGTNANEYGTIITIKISQFWAPIEIAGVNCSANWHVDTGNGNYDPNEVVTKLESAEEADSFAGGYKLISAVYNGAEVVVKLGLTEKLSTFPITIAKFNGSDLIEESWGGVHDSSWAVNASMETYDIEAPNSLTNSLVTEVTSSAQVQFVEMNIEKVNAVLLSKVESEGKAVYYGYTDGEENYIDCSHIANLTVFTGERVVKFDKFNSTNTNYGSEFKLGLPKLIATLGEDKEYIYSLISVPVYGAKTEYGLITIDEPLYYIQKISKEASETKIDGAYIPKNVETYQLSDSMVSGGNGWDGDNWSYRNAKDYIVNQYLNDANSKITVSNGAMYFIHMKTEDNGDKKLESAKIIFKDSGKVILSNGTEVKEKIAMVEFANSSKEEPEDWTVDNEGNAWCVYNGKIQRSNQGKEFEDMYRVDSSIDRLDVYDENNLIGWSTDAEIYVTNKEGEVSTTVVTKTGWRKEEDGKWHVYDVQGNQTKGWAKFGYCWYYFDENGAMTTGWLELNGKTYYLSNSGVMQNSWCKVDSTWYYFNQSGEKQSNTNVDGYSLDENGALKN